MSIENWPGGIRTASGGTRVNQIKGKLNRPWQVEMIVNPETCPFCTKPQNWIAEHPDKGDGFRVKKNDATPFGFHELVIPRQCWPPDKLRSLGGGENIFQALAIAEERMKENNSIREFLFGAHIGYLAGQNFGHQHWHLLHPMDGTDRGGLFKDLPILETEKFTVDCGGHRAGQCFILPRNDYLYSDPDVLREFAQLLNQTIGLYNAKFRSTQGLAPDYMIGVLFLDGMIKYASYVPILNHWGITEYLGLLENWPMILPWPHEETAKYLLSEE